MKKTIISVLLAALLALGVSAVGYDFGEGAVYYSFDSQSVTESTGKYSGSLIGNSIEYVEGLNGGYAVKMDNMSYVSIPVEVTCLKEEMSMIVWFKTSSLNAAWNRIISTGIWGAQPAPGVLIGLFNATDTGIQYVAVGIGADDASKNHWNLITAPDGDTPYKFDDNEWHCLGYTVGGGNGGLFLDGNLIYTFEYLSDFCSVTTYEETACIGGFLYYDNLNEPFAGTVDEAYFLPFSIGADTMKAYYDAERNEQIEHIASEPPTSSEESSVPAESSQKSDDTTAEKPTASVTEEKTVSSSQTENETKPAENGEKTNLIPIIAIVAAAVIAIAVVVTVLSKRKK